MTENKYFYCFHVFREKHCVFNCSINHRILLKVFRKKSPYEQQSERKCKKNLDA